MTQNGNVDGKDKSISKKSKDRAREEKFTTIGNDDESKREEGAGKREQRTTKLSSDIGSDSSSSNETSNKRRKAKKIVLIIFLSVVVVALFTALALTLRNTVFSKNGKSYGDNGKTIESTGHPPASFPSFPDLTNPADEKDDEKASMVIVEVTERSLTSIEINEGIDKDNLGLARSSTGIGKAQVTAAMHGTRKRNLEEAIAACDPCEYYKPIIFWTRRDVQRLLQFTHDALPYFGTRRNTNAALLDLHKINSTSTDVHLIYSNKTGLDLGSGSYTWNREHVWPCDRGVRCSRGNPDYTDIFNMFPADREVNIARGNRFFDDIQDNCTSGECVILEDIIKYGGANDAFQPPERVRGVIARAILYMDLRYMHLEVTDNPDPKKDNQMAYLSTLLRWHETYPPDAREIERNDLSCSKWQGNRNPYIDFPELAGILHGNSTGISVREIPQECITEAPTAFPSFSPTEPMEQSGGERNGHGALLTLVNSIFMLMCFLFLV